MCKSSGRELSFVYSQTLQRRDGLELAWAFASRCLPKGALKIIGKCQKETAFALNGKGSQPCVGGANMKYAVIAFECCILRTFLQ